MKKIQYILTALCLMFIMAGCNLDVRMYDGIMMEDFNTRNIQDLSQGSYRLLKNDGGLIDNGYPFWNFGADDITWNGTSTGGTFYMYEYSRNIGSTVTEYAWELGYRTVGNCNLVIETIEGLGNGRTEEDVILMGENFYLRALCYFLLVNEFAQPYSNNPAQNPGLPLKLNYDPDDLPPSRATVAEVYDQIVKDLQDAIRYLTLPDGMKPKSNIYATKEAAQALLARVYLYMERWDEAREMADAVIQSGRFELETGERYAIYPQHIPENNKETIFAVRRTIEKDDVSSSRPGGMFIRIDNNGWEEMSPSSRYLELLELHLNDRDMPQDLRSRFVIKRYVEDGASDYSVTGYPDKVYRNWTFAYARKQSGDNAHYEYIKIKVSRQEDGTYRITNASDASPFRSDVIQSEPCNLGKRFYVTGTNGIKYIGRIEPEVFDAATKRNKDARFLVYAINKCSYQEQRLHLWSTVISRLAEMYLIRAEVSAVKGNTQDALDDVNLLRRRAGIPEWTVDNMATAEDGQQKDIKKIVEEERMLELAWEGHRRFDIFRTRQTLDRRYPGGHTLRVGGQFLDVPYNSPSVCEFIPQAQYDAYPYKLEQNP
ncbi:MAG: RagB/SusD family nutrient uptake outer membrane protein [Tannerella sp.]|jgi:tetratricopeptide (TPR) repeat protein|nr:RagB/SusD family nutrient uptake outer membrane protein [Tannerella sp.]